MTAPVPGLVIARDPGPRESYSVVHEVSGVPVILSLAGAGSAQGAADDLAPLLDWTLTARRVLTVLEAFPELLCEMERIASRWGGTSYGHLPGDESPFQVSA